MVPPVGNLLPLGVSGISGTAGATGSQERRVGWVMETSLGLKTLKRGETIHIARGRRVIRAPADMLAGTHFSNETELPFLRLFTTGSAYIFLLVLRKLICDALLRII